jgi:hypothetical protein
MDMLEAPEFFFEIETKRIARDLDPGFEANVPPGIGSDRTYQKQTDEVDLADFDAAIKAGDLKPPDAEKARAAHDAAIKALKRATEEGGDDAATPAPEADLPSSTAAPAPAAASTPSAAAAVAPAPAPAEFASEFADYHRGAAAYHSHDTDAAEKIWKALLARPAAERKYRTTWANYMLGKMALDAKQPDDARGYFRKVREEAKAGAVDSLGLAAASIGWEAYLELDAKHFPAAARLYLQQLATGDPTAVNSLRAVLDQFTKEEQDPAKWMSDPIMQRLATAASLCGIGSFDEPSTEPGNPTPQDKWLKLLEKVDAKQVKDADCVAWLEYQKGDYKAAERWLKVADANSPYSLWLKAKLALRDGKVEAAMQLLSRAVPKLPQDSALESRDMEFETLPGDISKGDLAALLVGRADFLAAVRLFVQVRNCDDAVYLAEGVLTLPELKKYVDELPVVKKPEEGREDYDQPEDLRRLFSDVVARRLVRAGKYDEARPYLDEEDQKILDEYVGLLKVGNDAKSPKPKRAEALWAAAQLMSEKGGALYDFDLPAAMAGRLAGRKVEEREVPFVPSRIVFGEPIKFLPPVTETEKKRLKANVAPGLHRYNSGYVAADLGWRAAQLMPDNEEETAVVLNTSGSWLKKGDDKAADRFYQALERRCPKTEIGKEAIKRHWFVETAD